MTLKLKLEFIDCASTIATNVKSKVPALPLSPIENSS